MKKLFLSLFFCSCSSILMAGVYDNPRLPSVNSWISQGVYVSSAVIGVSSGTVSISSYPAILFAILISQTGSQDSKLEVWNHPTATGTNMLFPTIDTSSTTRSFPFWANVYCSSGISIFNQGTTPAKVSIIYRQK